MRLEEQKQAEVLTAGDGSDSIKMSLDMDSAQLLMQMLSRNIYQDAIGSTVRETVSNALDSVRRAGVNEPVIVTLIRKSGSDFEFSVEDFGLGLDDKEVEGIISKYGASTKRESEIELGMWGLGFKSPLAYSSSFTFVCRKDGVERKYMMYEGEDVNTIDLLYESPTTERNGLKVTVPVKYGDRGEFTLRIREQLAYFDNVFFNVDSSPATYSYAKGDYLPKTVPNDFIIHRDKAYQWSDLVTNGDMHLCLDNVYYPLDFEKLGISRINVPIALRFGLSDSIFPTINREAIRYTPESKEVILKKLKEVCTLFIEKYNKSITDIDDIFLIAAHYMNKEKLIKIDEKEFDIQTMRGQSDTSISYPKMKGVDLLDIKKLSENMSSFLGEYRIRYTLKGDRLLSYDGYLFFGEIERQNHKIFIHSEPLLGNKKMYIKSLMKSGDKIVKKTKSYKLGVNDKDGWTRDGYYNLLKLGKYRREDWRTVIKEFQYIQSLITSKFEDVDKINVPQSWLDARKKRRTYSSSPRKLKTTGEVNAKVAENLMKNVNGQNCKFVPNTIKIEDFRKYKGLTIYTHHDHYSKLDGLFLISEKMKVRFLTFSSRELKTIDSLNIHNLISYKEFMKGKHIVFRRMATARLIHKLRGDNLSVFGMKGFLGEFSTSLSNKLKVLDNYRSKYYKETYTDEVQRNAIVDIAREFDLFDPSIYDIYLDVKNTLEEHPYINTISKEFGVYGKKDHFMSILRDMMKYHKFRMNYKNYKLKGVPLWIPEQVEDNN